MAIQETSEAGFTPNGKALMAGAILMAAGGVIGMAGFAVAGVSLAAATRRWIAAMEVPPSELARHHWHRARTAALAGAGAWRDGATREVVGS